MTNKPLVSMITYCYNGESFINGYFEAVLKQTYSNIELIFIDNGSQDKTFDIAKSYESQLSDKGITFRLIRKEVNNPHTMQVKKDAIMIMNGDYFFGCDSDDIIYPEYVERMVGYLIDNPEKGLVFCNLNAVNENGARIGELKAQKQTKPMESFENIIQCKNSIFPPHSYMISKKWLDMINPERNFYISEIGENYQMEIPFLYNNLQGYIDEPLAQYVVRTKSVSHDMDLKRRIKFLDQQETIISETLRILGEDVHRKYNHLNHNRVVRDKFYLTLLTEDKDLIKDAYSVLKKEKLLTFKIRLKYYLSKNKVLKKLLRRRKKS